jgi:gamma-glutamylcyclotransferase (GGCT)/AIG2-like uncharacterized protein YtfP
MKYYFAYGSNMAGTQMFQRCPGCRTLGRAQLQGYRWIISTRGFANIIRSENEVVEGVLYAISAADEAALDEHEGVAKGCYYKETLAIRFAGKELEAMVYIDPTVCEAEPKDEYVDRMHAALSEADLPSWYVAKYMGRFIGNQGSQVSVLI